MESQIAGNFLKKWSKRGVPLFWALFWQFGGFPVKTVCQTGLPEDASQQRKRYTTPSWVISEALPRVYFALPACLEPKYTLWRASETQFWEVAGNPDYPIADLGRKVRKSPS